MRRETEAPEEFPVRPLHAVELLAGRTALHAPLTLHDEVVVLEAQVDVGLLEPGELEAEDDPPPRLVDVGDGSPCADPALGIEVRPRESAFEELVHPLLDADEAHKLRELADVRNEAEALAYQTEKSLKEHRDKLDESVASTVEGRIMELRGVLESGDVSEIRAKADALQEAWTDAASAIYAQASASTPTDGGAASSTSDDEVIEDADYEVVDEEEAKTS